MNIKRDWATPLTAGAFVLMAVTGILMFFHLDTGLNKEAHEWLGWAMVTGVAFHVIANWKAFLGHLKNTKGKALIGTFVVLLALSFLQLEEEGGKGGPKYRAAVQAMAELPISTLATMAKVTPEQLRERLQQHGVQATSNEQSVSELVGQDDRRQVDVIIKLFQPPQ